METEKGREHDDAGESTARKARILIDPITGCPVLSAGPGAPVLTSEEVDEILYGKS